MKETYKEIYKEFKHNKQKFVETFMLNFPNMSKLTAQRVWYKCREEDPKPSRMAAAKAKADWRNIAVKPNDKKLLLLKFKKEEFEEDPNRLHIIFTSREIKWIKKQGIIAI